MQQMQFSNDTDFVHKVESRTVLDVVYSFSKMQLSVVALRIGNTKMKSVATSPGYIYIDVQCLRIFFGTDGSRVSCFGFRPVYR